MSLRAPPPSQPTRTPSNRLSPPPSLFVPPPNAPTTPTAHESTESLDSPTTATGDHGTRNPSRNDNLSTGPQHHARFAGTAPADTAPLHERQRQPSATAATWRALQSTLDEVEHNAQSGASVFGAEHSRALEELRRAQVELARAWARSEGDGDDDDGGAADDGGAGTERSGVLKMRRVEDEPGGAFGARTQLAGGRTALEEETAAEVWRARARRLANDRYFARVNAGVVDVVGRLEGVAQKMGGVEMESQEIWGGEEEEEGDAKSGSSGSGDAADGVRS